LFFLIFEMFANGLNMSSAGFENETFYLRQRFFSSKMLYFSTLPALLIFFVSNRYYLYKPVAPVILKEKFTYAFGKLSILTLKGFVELGS